MLEDAEILGISGDQINITQMDATTIQVDITIAADSNVDVSSVHDVVSGTTFVKDLGTRTGLPLAAAEAMSMPELPVVVMLAPPLSPPLPPPLPEPPSNPTLDTSDLETDSNQDISPGAQPSGLSGGAIAGIVIGVLLALAFGLFLGLYRKKKKGGLPLPGLLIPKRTGAPGGKSLSTKDLLSSTDVAHKTAHKAESNVAMKILEEHSHGGSNRFHEAKPVSRKDDGRLTEEEMSAYDQHFSKPVLTSEAV